MIQQKYRLFEVTTCHQVCVLQMILNSFAVASCCLIFEYLISMVVLCDHFFFLMLIQPKIQDELIIAREIVINDAESSVRFKLTKRQTQEEVYFIWFA